MQKRPLTSTERTILERLLSKPFPGSDELTKQLDGCTAIPTSDKDSYGSIYLFPVSSHKADVAMRVPVEGISADLDGGSINLLLHVVDGYLNELEIVKLDGTALRGEVSAHTVKIAVNSYIKPTNPRQHSY